MNPKSILRWLTLVTMFALLVILLWNIFAPLNSDQMVIRIKKGDNAAAIGKKLKQNRIIRSASLFKALASLRGTDRLLIAGTYTLGGNNSLYRTLKLLEEGNVSAVKVSIPEGFSLHKTLQRIEKSGLASYEELDALARDSLFVERLTGFHAPSLEGFLYPETYHFDLGSTPADILKQMTSQFFSQVRAAGLEPARIPEFYQLLILASIVEKESTFEDERPLVASVMRNRLEAGMRLASCPTVDYVLERQGVKKPVLSLQDTQIQSPYNTYRNFGLPPSPICNPGVSSLKAALNPAKTDFFYFVADRKGRNDFSATAEEHLRKAASYKRAEWE